MLRCFAGFRACLINYLGPKDEALAEITIVALDLQSGHVADGDPRFIEPTSSVDMNAFVDREVSWKRAGFGPEQDEERPENREGKHWAEDYMYHEGGFMLSALKKFASSRFAGYFNPDWKTVCG